MGVVVSRIEFLANASRSFSSRPNPAATNAACVPALSIFSPPPFNYIKSGKKSPHPRQRQGSQGSARQGSHGLAMAPVQSARDDLRPSDLILYTMTTGAIANRLS